MQTARRILALLTLIGILSGCATKAHLVEIGAPDALPGRVQSLDGRPSVQLNMCIEGESESSLRTVAVQTLAGFGTCDTANSLFWGRTVASTAEAYDLHPIAADDDVQPDIVVDGKITIFLGLTLWQAFSAPFRGDAHYGISYDARLKIHAGKLELGQAAYHARVSTPMNTLHTLSDDSNIEMILNRRAIENLYDQLFAQIRLHHAGLWQLSKALNDTSVTLPNTPIKVDGTVPLLVEQIHAFGPASEASANALTNALIGTAGQSPCISSGSRAANVQTNRVLDPVLGRHELHDIYNVLPIRPGYRVAGSIATYENRLLLNTVIFDPGGNAIARHLLAGEPGEDESALFARFAKGLTARLSCPASESEEAQRTL